jgi:ribonuclease HII
MAESVVTIHCDDGNGAKALRLSPPPLSPPRSRSAHAHCGVDEVARGCLFGRVYAGAVAWGSDAAEAERVEAALRGAKKVVVRDSKRMTRAQRERADAWIRAHARAVSVAFAEATEIDATNIRRATFAAMGRAVREVGAATGEARAMAGEDRRGAPPSASPAAPPPLELAHVLVDGSDYRGYALPGATTECVVGGDRTYFAVACASIVAKVAHDRYVWALCAAHPRLEAWYQLRANVGYGTAAHREGIARHGLSPWHRRTFATCRGHDDASWWSGEPATAGGEDAQAQEGGEAGRNEEEEEERSSGESRSVNCAAPKCAARGE